MGLSIKFTDKHFFSYRLRQNCQSHFNTICTLLMFMSFILQNSNPWIGLQFLGSGKKQIRSRLRQKNETVYYCEGDDFTKAIMILAFLCAYGFLRGEIFVWCHIHVAQCAGVQQKGAAKLHRPYKDVTFTLYSFISITIWMEAEARSLNYHGDVIII